MNADGGGDGGPPSFQQNFSTGALPLDLLFMVDDSSNMNQVQDNLAINFPVFVNILESLPVRPDLHLAVVTSDMGAGAFTASVPGCMAPDLGNFVSTPRAPADPTACATNRLNSGEHFIIDAHGGTQKNYTGDLAPTFGCLAQVGSSGCGFEHQLAAVRAALGDPMMSLPAPAGNANFLRDDAVLGIIWVTNEDDCSAPPNSELFDPNQNSLSDPLGPLSSFRCTEFGILCSGQKPPRQAAGPLANCVSNDGAAATDPLHSLVPVQFYRDYFRRVKTIPNRIFAAAIAAPTDPFVVVVDPQTGFPGLQASCNTVNGDYGIPGVRLKQLVDSFGANGTYASVCNNSYSDTLSVIANGIGRVLSDSCVNGVIASTNSGFTMAIPTPAPGLVVDPNVFSCSVTDIQYLGTPMEQRLDTLLPCSPVGNTSGQCFAFLGDPACGTGIKLAVCRNGFDPANPSNPCPPGPNQVPDGVTEVLSCRTVP
jgi:hypothetical protein